MRLILIRHGEAVGNASGVMLGRQDVPLTERGRQQALALRENSRHRMPFTRVRCNAATIRLRSSIPVPT